MRNNILAKITKALLNCSKEILGKRDWICRDSGDDSACLLQDSIDLLTRRESLENALENKVQDSFTHPGSKLDQFVQRFLEDRCYAVPRIDRMLEFYRSQSSIQ